MRVLVVDDDEKILSFLVNGLKQEGYIVDMGRDGDEACGLLLTRQYDAAVLDIMMPKVDGLAVIQKVRDEGIKTPILILSAKHKVDDRVTGLRAGGDDYMTKPFAFSELIARLQSLVRRARGSSEPTLYTVGDLSLDVLKHEARRGGNRIELQPREFALLLYLMRNANRVVSKTMIMEHVWGYNFDPQTNVVESRLSRLRDKIDEGFAHPYIHTVRGVGYVIRAEDQGV
jgi:two-component system OmpR family response regulator